MKIDKSNIRIYEGNSYFDNRGKLRYVDRINFGIIKRIYQIENTDIDFIRAFHGHFKECKFVYIASGSILLNAVFLTDKIRPSRRIKPQSFLLSSSEPKVLYVPPGYAQGFRMLEKETSVLFFSNLSFEESVKDDYRIPYDYWGKKIWEINNLIRK